MTQGISHLPSHPYKCTHLPNSPTPTSTTMANQQLIQSFSGIDDDSTALFQSSPYPLYYIQSPSTTSHSTNTTVTAAIPPPSSSDSGAFLSPTFPPHHHHDSARGRLPLSPYSSSSRGSNNDSFIEEKKHEMIKLKRGSSSNGAKDEEEEVGSGEIRRITKGLMEKLVVLDSNEYLCCVVLQFGWRITVSLILALLVFFLATNPPEPEFSFKIVNVRHFSLGEGLDETGVPTKVLSFNCSVDMEVVNKSKFFGLLIYPPLLEMDFGSLKFARSQSQAAYVESTSSSIRRLFIGLKNKPMYGAGRNMEDLLESEQGLSLMVQIQTRSSYRVVWNLIKIKHHHLENCVVILQAIHDPKLYTELHNSSCSQA